jgi:hypothetical protein
MTKTILGFLLSVLTLAAADVTGTWTGTLKATRDDGSEHTDSAHIVLKQQGSDLTGFAGGGPDDQNEISAGKVEGDEVTFKIVRGEREMRISLKLSADGNKMTGQIQRQRDGVTQTAQLDVSRSK